MTNELTTDRLRELVAAADAQTFGDAWVSIQRAFMAECWSHRHQIIALMEREARLTEALERIMVGGNHLGLLIGADHPADTTDPMDALEHYGAGDTYDIWCCWRSIRLASAALQPKEAKP